MNLKKLLKCTTRFLLYRESRFGYFNQLGLYNNWTDEKFLKKKFKLCMRYELNLFKPTTFNEKLQWLKLNDRKKIYTILVDKIAVKKYVADMIGEEYIIPSLGEWDDPKQIEFDKLPSQFVLKCNHNSGLGMCICTDKNNLDIVQTRKVLAKGLKQNYYKLYREWPYKDVKPRIIAEKFMNDSCAMNGLKDYKFYCFNGIPRFLYISQGLEKHETAKLSYVTMDWKKTEFYRDDYEQFDVLPEAPQNFNLMKELAVKLAKDIPFVRVDFYEIDGHVYFGEMTFFPGAGFTPIKPYEWDKKLGDWLVLPDKSL